jgi:hypothetical protein
MSARLEPVAAMPPTPARPKQAGLARRVPVWPQPIRLVLRAGRSPPERVALATAAARERLAATLRFALRAGSRWAHPRLASLPMLSLALRR